MIRRVRPATPLGWILVVVMLLGGRPAEAWDDEGHMIIAEIAWQRLDASRRERVSHLLALNPDYAGWTAHVAAAERNEIAFLRAATWADSIKSGPGYVFDGNRPAGADAARNIGYADHLQHRYWHYIDEPLSSDGTPGRAPDEPNVKTQIRLFRATLRSSAPDELKSYDLVWLEHLIGDVHQPLHTTSRFSRSLPQGDAGGNLVLLCALPCRDELHAYWDTILGRDRRPSQARRLAARISATGRIGAGSLDEQRWVDESVAAARKVVYVGPIGSQAGPYRLDPAYRTQAQAEAGRRMAAAGARLAAVIRRDLR